jgi:hypothetical protein
MITVVAIRRQANTGPRPRARWSLRCAICTHWHITDCPRANARDGLLVCTVADIPSTGLHCGSITPPPLL